MIRMRLVITIFRTAASRIMLVLMLVLMLDSCIGKRITKANVDQVTEGMSKKQVESILGQPTSSKTEGQTSTRQTTYVYRQGKDTVTIGFKDRTGVPKTANVVLGEDPHIEVVAVEPTAAQRAFRDSWLGSRSL